MLDHFEQFEHTLLSSSYLLLAALASVVFMGLSSVTIKTQKNNAGGRAGGSVYTLMINLILTSHTYCKASFSVYL